MSDKLYHELYDDILDDPGFIEEYESINKQRKGAGKMRERKLGWDIGTEKLQTYSESQDELINDLQAKVYSREIENKRMRVALEDAHTRLCNIHGHEWEEVTSRVQDILEGALDAC